MATVLPRPVVKVEKNPDTTTVDVTVTRPNPGGNEAVRAYRSYRSTTEEVVKDVLDQVLADPLTAECLP